MSANPVTFGVARLCRLVETHTGQVLSDSMRTRLGDSLQAQATGSGVEAYIGRLEAPVDAADREALQQFLNLYTVGKTSYFRYPEQLALICQVLLPALHQQLPNGAPLNIWCAACSTGEEPFSLAMAMAETGWLGPAAPRPVHLLGSDFNSDSLTMARSGRVHPLRREPLLARAPQWLREDAAGTFLAPALCQQVRFTAVNLSAPGSYPLAPGGWHLLLCANVLFYFNPRVVAQVLQRCHQLLAPQAAFLVGGAEMLPAWPGGGMQVLHARGAFAYVCGLTELTASSAGDRPAESKPSGPGQPAADDDCPPWTTTGGSVATGSYRLEPATVPGQAAAHRAPLQHVALAAPCSAPTAPPWARPLALGDWPAALAAVNAADDAGLAGRDRLQGLLALRLGQWALACTALDNAQAEDPFAFELHYLQGMAHAQLGNALEAEAALRRSLFLQPHGVWARLAFACQLHRAGAFDLAVAEYSRAQSHLEAGHQISPLVGPDIALAAALIPTLPELRQQLLWHLAQASRQIAWAAVDTSPSSTVWPAATRWRS